MNNICTKLIIMILGLAIIQVDIVAMSPRQRLQEINQRLGQALAPQIRKKLLAEKEALEAQLGEKEERGPVHEERKPVQQKKSIEAVIDDLTDEVADLLREIRGTGNEDVIRTLQRAIATQ